MCQSRTACMHQVIPFRHSQVLGRFSQMTSHVSDSQLGMSELIMCHTVQSVLCRQTNNSVSDSQSGVSQTISQVSDSRSGTE